MPFSLFNRKLGSYALLTAFLFILAITTNYFVKTNNENPEKKHRQFQKAFHEAENQGLYYLIAAIGAHDEAQSFFSLQA